MVQLAALAREFSLVHVSVVWVSHVHRSPCSLYRHVFCVTLSCIETSATFMPMLALQDVCTATVHHRAVAVDLCSM